MGRKLRYLGPNERAEIEKLHNGGAPAVVIAGKIGANVATVYRELNNGYTGDVDEYGRKVYKAALAQENFEKNIKRRGERAGYPIFREKNSYYSRICDLGCRLEIMKADGTSINVWNEPQKPAEKPAHYGNKLAEKIKAKTEDFSKISPFDKFVLDYGYKYATEEELRAEYDRSWRASHNILITLEDFLVEAGKKPSDPAADTYEALVGLVEEKKLQPRDVMEYAHFRWCLNKPEAVVVYQTAPDKWTVNNCDTEITEERAKVEVCEEWGFEASRVRIIGTPYYDATDWQFIRFNCGHECVKSGFEKNWKPKDRRLGQIGKEEEDA